MTEQPPPKAVTRLLAAVGEGKLSAQDELWSLIYAELRSLARQELARAPAGQTLQPTALVHEAYLRLVGDENVRWANRRHFFPAAAQAMRRIRIDEARRRHRLKRGGRRQRVPLEEAASVSDQDPAEVLAIDEVLDRLGQIDRRKSEIVTLRFFGGLSIAQTANALGLSPRTVKNEWRFARAWLHRELEKGDTAIQRRGDSDDR